MEINEFQSQSSKKNRENNMQSNLVLSALISRIFGENKNDGIFFYEVLTKNP